MLRISREGRGLPSMFGLSFVIGLTAFLSVLVMKPPGAHASGQVGLAWQRSPETTVIGYRVYFGYSSGRYSRCLNVGNRLTYTLKGLTVGKKYYIAVAAYDFYDNESKTSKEISYTPTDTIALGAETGSLTPPMALASDARASTGSDNLADHKEKSRTAVSNFQVPAADKLLIRDRVSDTVPGRNSFFISMYDDTATSLEAPFGANET